MIWNWKRGLGIGLIFAGIFIIFTARVLTGAVVGFSKENYLGIFGILVFVVGVVMVLAEEESLEDLLAKEPTIKDKVRLLEKLYTRGRFDEVEFAEQINKISELIGGCYKPQDQLRIDVANSRISLRDKYNHDLAVAIYRRILANDPAYIKNCEFHFGKEASTKHHKKGIKNL